MNEHVFPEQPAVERAGAASQQLVPQRVLVQLMSQPEPVQTALPLAEGGLHLVPQLRQFEVSVARFTQELPQRVLLPQSTTQVPFSHSWLAEQDVLQEPQYCDEVFRSTAPLQLPHWLLLHVCVPVLQLPQLRESPVVHATHWPELGRHTGVLPEQLVWFVQLPSVPHRRGVTPTHWWSPGLQAAHLLPTQKPVLHSVLWLQGSPRLQLPQLMPAPEHEFRLLKIPSSPHWWAIPLLHSAVLGTQSTHCPVAGRQ